jgi:hypothetical protein
MQEVIRLDDYQRAKALTDAMLAKAQERKELVSDGAWMREIRRWSQDAPISHLGALLALGHLALEKIGGAKRGGRDPNGVPCWRAWLRMRVPPSLLEQTAASAAKSTVDAKPAAVNL